MYLYSMPKAIKSPLLILLLVLIIGKVNAQSDQFRFQHYSSENGLIQNTVYDICQDKYGFIWLSTKNGVCRYDGYETKVYKPSSFTKTEVVDLSQCIEIDTDGKIVFGTGAGIFFISPEKDSITRRVSFASINYDDIFVNNIFAICPDKNILWIGTGNGLIRFDKITGKVKYFNSEALIPGWKSKRCWIKSIIKNDSGSIYIATQKGLVEMNTTTFKTNVYSRAGTGKYFIDNDYFSSLSFDKEGRLWSGSLRQGVFCMDLQSGIYRNLNFTGLTDSAEEFNEIKRIIVDKEGFVWAGTQYTGLARINSRDFSIQRIKHNILVPNGLSSDLISALYEDRNGILWIGTYDNGVNRTNLKGTRFVNIPYASPDSLCFNIKAVDCFGEQNDEFVWVGTMKGLYRFNQKTYTCNTFESITENKIKLPHHSVAGVAFRNENEMWVATRSEVLSKVNLAENTVKYYAPDTTNPLLKGINDLKMIFKSGKGELYFSFDNRIMKYDPQSDQLKLVLDRDSILLGLTRITRFFVDSENRLFIFCDYNGVFIFDQATNRISKLESPEPEIYKLSQFVSIKQLQNGNYILSDYSGFYELDKSLNFHKHYSTNEGLCENKITNQEPDRFGSVWFSTFNGLSRFDTLTKKITNYFIQDGLAENEFRESKSMQTKKGMIYFANNRGFTFFEPGAKPDTGITQQVFFTSFKIFGNEVTFSKNLNDLKAISVPAGNNFFTISFASLGYQTLHRPVFYYMLEGVDKSWIEAGMNQHSAHYTNIDGGKYLFKVKGAGDYAPIKQLTIEVGTVFYKTWWFRLLLVGTLLALIYLLIRFREKHILKNESEKTIEYFANSFYGRNSVDEILWDVCRNCISRLGFQDAVVYLLDEKRNMLVQKAAYGPKNPKDFEISHPMEIPVGKGIVGTVAQTGKPEIISDTLRDPRYIADDDCRMSELSVPIVYEGKVIGVIDSEHSQRNFFTREHLRLLSTIASICSTKIAKAQLDQEASDRERLLLEVGKKVAETRLMALRAQMNPHFIFNSLNSIQECVVSGKFEEAQKYLIRFSKLLRMVIDHSEQNTISLDQELEFLNIYLELESLRFGKSFEYNIHVDGDIDPEEFSIPSLIVQPFIENAIWHGLLHKEGKRLLNISFRIEKDEHLIFIVEDNGIGREKAAEIKSGKFMTNGFQSKGMKITQERIELVKLQTKFRPEIEFVDLKNDAGIACGTRVIVTLPLDEQNT